MNTTKTSVTKTVTPLLRLLRPTIEKDAINPHCNSAERNTRNNRNSNNSRNSRNNIYRNIYIIETY